MQPRTPQTPLHSPADARLQAILQHVYRADGITRAELSRATDVNPVSVARLVTELIDLGLVAHDASFQTTGRRGRPSNVLRINRSACHVVGIEFGRDHLIALIADSLGEVVWWRAEAAPPAFSASESTVQELATVARASASAAGVPWESVNAIGLALHGVVSASGRWVTSERFGDEPFPVGDLFTSILGRNTTVEDVSRAFAEAEHRFGAGDRHPDMIYVFLGSHGVGSGIFVNGRLLKSSSGVCGELGHIIVDEGGKLCFCGSRGCLETVASHQAVIGQVKALLEQGVRMSLSETEPLTFAAICRAVNAGDKGASLVLHRLTQSLSTALASLINLAGTPRIVIGGQLSLAGEGFLADLTSAIRRRVIALLARDLNVSYARLPAYAGAWGAAVQALEAEWLSGRVLERTRAPARSPGATASSRLQV